jgi:hypothetical protein
MRSVVNRFLFLFVIPTVLLLSAASCKKSNSGSNGSFTATINGTAWVANIQETGALITITNIFDLGGIQYKSGDSTAIGLTFSSLSQFGQPINSTDSAAQIDVTYVDIKAGIQYDGGLLAGHSTITITSYDSLAGKIAGTFSGVLYNISGGSDSLMITNGIFNSNFVPD